ncbi:MAG: alpha/beta hydrolase-fold protein [Bacteroidota bacterium]|nr:alpha/beta hydrolase-fold protein [Bacteroidota bacterium]
MKQKFRRPLFLILFVLAFYNKIHAQADTVPPRVEIPNTQVLKFTSSVTDQEYLLYINLPGGYLKEKARTFPVVYLLDGQYDFPFLTGVYGGQYYDGFLPAFITVGITWGGKDPNAGLLRGRDFTPTHIMQMPESGNGPKFLEFIKTELIPFISSRYRVTDDRTLIGSSLGGLFTLYALFNDPSLFHRYVLTSPALAWDNGVLRTFEGKYEAHGSSTPVRLFMGIGALEPNVPEFQQFVVRLKEKKVRGLEFKTLVMDNTGHAGTKPEGFARGLQYVFERPSLQLASDILDQYTGTYLIGTDTIQISKEGGKLMGRNGNNPKMVLEAETERDFYVKGVFIKLHFEPDDTGKVPGFQLEQFDGGVFAKKVN